MTVVHTFASGSSGNALLVSCGGGRLLVDAGVSCRRITQGLKSLGLDLEDIAAVLITHTHSDHISGLQTLLKKTACPVWASEPAAWDLKERFPDFENRFQAVPTCRKLPLKDCAVTAVPTAHDAPGSCGYRFDTPAGSVGLLTDTGRIPSEAEEFFPGTDLMILEANHDIETLKSGPYPYYLKKRILGPEGHLSNDAAGRFAAFLAGKGTSEIILAHLSQENNTPSMALNAVRRALEAAGFDAALSVAPRDALSAAHTVQAAKLTGIRR